MSSERTPEEIAASHRWHAIECNNLAWKLSETPSRTAHQDDEMIDAAHAAAFHWGKVGTPLHTARAEMLLAHVHALVGRGATAELYARRSYDCLVANQPPDWELAFAEAIRAHGAHAGGDSETHRRHYARAAELGRAIVASEDREIFEATFARIPRP